MAGKRMAARGIEPFRSFIFSQRCGENAARLNNIARLKGVDVPLRLRLDVASKKPAGQQPSQEPHGLGSGYHQVSLLSPRGHLVLVAACSVGSLRIGRA